MWRRLVPGARRAAAAEAARSCAGAAAQQERGGSSSQLLLGLLAGGASGAACAYAVVSANKGGDQLLALAEERRRMLPKRIILVRHGESMGNADHTLYRTKADNQIELTDKGSQQAKEAGQRIKKVIGDESVHLFVSPFERTLQTARNVREAFDSQIKHTYIESRIREQEFGNLQGDDFKNFRTEQNHVGRFWYRFPNGESGADVYDRVKNWWDDSLLNINIRSGYTPVDNVVVVTHGLTMRFVLMQLYGWSPNTFHTVWNAGNCHIYVLTKDLSLKGESPYKLDETQGDMPESSIQIGVTFKRRDKQWLEMKNYLSLPQPRTRQLERAKQLLQEQHGLDPASIVDLDFFGGKFAKYR